MSYFILPTHKLSIQTPKTPLEVLDCLKLQVDDYWYSDNELKFKKTEGFFVGEIDGYKFSIRKAGRRTGLTPLIKGSIREHSEGSIIDIVAGIQYFELIFASTMIIPLLIIPIVFKLGLILMFLFGLFGYKSERQEVIAFLKKILL